MDEQVSMMKVIFRWIVTIVVEIPILMWIVLWVIPFGAEYGRKQEAWCWEHFGTSCPEETWGMH